MYFAQFESFYYIREKSISMHIKLFHVCDGGKGCEPAVNLTVHSLKDNKIKIKHNKTIYTVQ